MNTSSFSALSVLALTISFETLYEMFEALNYLAGIGWQPL